jgi:ribosome-associated heat shock protein Hsp15
MAAPGPDIRIDKWLWAARFFKTRALAREAVSGGKVQCNGYRVKPGRTLKPGDQLNVTRGDENFQITVMETTNTRLSASQAQLMYVEAPASLQRREAMAEQRKREREARLESRGRPTKRERRQIVDFTRGRE